MAERRIISTGLKSIPIGRVGDVVNATIDDTPVPHRLTRIVEIPRKGKTPARREFYGVPVDDDAS